MSWRDSASAQVRASAIWPTAAAAWLSSSLSGPSGNLSTARPSAMAPDETTMTSRLSRCSAARSAESAASHASLSLPALASTRSEEPTLTTMRRKSANRRVFMFRVIREIEPQLLQFSFVFQLGLVLEAIIAGQPAHQLAAFPIVEDAADVLAGEAGDAGKMALADLLADDDAARADVLAEILRQFEQGAGDAAAQRQKTSRRDHRVGFAQSRGEQRHQRFVDLRMLLGEVLERGAAEEAQDGIAHRHHRSRARQTVDGGIPAAECAGAEKGQDPLAAATRHHVDLEQTVFDAIAAVAGIPGHEQGCVGRELDRRRGGEQVRREVLGQPRQQARTGTVRRHDAHRR